MLFFLKAFDDATDDSVSLNFEDNIGKTNNNNKNKWLNFFRFWLDGKFSSFSKTNIRLSRQSNFEISPSRTISSSRLIDDPFYTLKIHFKRGTIQDYVMTSIPMVDPFISFWIFNLFFFLPSVWFYNPNFNIPWLCLLMKMVISLVHKSQLEILHVIFRMNEKNK
jgi:hypothetical protein